MSTQLKISKGPSKYDLMLGLFDKPNGERFVTFVVELPQMTKHFKVQLNQVTREDGGAESWLFEGWSEVYHQIGVETRHFGRPIIKETWNAELTGFWNTKSRTGYLNLNSHVRA